MNRKGMGWPAAALVASALAACASPPEEMPRPEGDSPQELVTSLEVQVGTDSVRLHLHATNVAETPLVLNFASGQRFDFAVHQEGRQIWRWSEGRAFTQALGTQTISPGETVTYSATWVPEGRTGEFRAVGSLPASERSIRQEASFALPPEGS